MGSFSETIKQLRIAQQLELRETAHLVGIPPVYLSRLERGKEAPPDESVIRALAKVFAADPEGLLRLSIEHGAPIPTLVGQHPNMEKLVKLLLERDFSDEQVRRVERFVRREVLGDVSTSSI